MSSRKVLKGASFLSGSEVINQACGLIRNMILARFLTKADFGVAALLGTILSVFEMTSKMALSQQVIQSEHSDVPAFVNSVHFTQVALASLSALLILIFAWPLAHFFAGPQYMSTIMALALIPFLNGFTNLEVYKQSRRLSFGPQVLSDTVPQVVTTLAAWPLALLFHDYRTILCLLLGKSLMNVIMTHLLAATRFTPRFNRDWLKESLKFGWPLLLAGFIQLGNFQGDSMVIAARYTLAQLGEFSVALTLAMAPGLVLLRVCHTVSLPLLVEVQNDLPRLTARYSCYVELMALLSCFATLGMAFCGEQMIFLLFGAKYAGIGALACCLTAVQGLRIVRGATVGAAMARGDTVNNLVSSIWRLSGLPLAICVGALHGSLTWFALTGVVGELIALSSAIFRLSAKHSISPQITIMPTLLGLSYVIIAVAIKWALPLPPYSWLNWPMLITVLSLNAAVFMLCFPSLRAMIRDFVQKIRTRLWAPIPVL
jgi:O-antigen/teichoic acid export membrane protein